MAALQNQGRTSPPPPCEIYVELHRTTGDPTAFRVEPQEYLLRRKDGTDDKASFPWSAALLADLAAVQRDKMDPAAAARLGKTLQDFLRKLGWATQEAELRTAQRDKCPIHVTLCFSAAELYALPWELLPIGATGQRLGAIPGCLIRYAWPGTETAPLAPDPPPEAGRILFAWSAAGGAVPVSEHQTALRRACHEAHYPFDEARDVLPAVSLKSLTEALKANVPGDDGVLSRPIVALHILCHGGRVASATEAYGLVWNAWDAADDAPEVIDAATLGDAIAEAAGALRLCVLSACQSGDAGALDNALGSVAHALHQRGIAAVVASRYPLSVDASIDLTETLYSRLLLGSASSAQGLASLEEAFVAARARLQERANRVDWASLQLYAREDDGCDHRPLVFRPYRGLLPFQQEHRRYFFGRNAEVAETVQDLKALIDAKDAARPRFLVVAGASGTGKSSLVFASALPTLVQVLGEGCASATMRPGGGMVALDKILAARVDAMRPLILVVDQFEELFTAIADPAQRQAFVRRLWELAGDPGSGVSVILTVRLDFLGRFGEITLNEAGLRLDRVAFDEAHRVFIPQMGHADLRDAIEQPAEEVGLSLESGLAARMLDDVGEEPGALPLLEYTLDQVWQRRRGKLLTAAAYDALGGVAGALETKADELINGLEDEPRKQAARRLLVSLVSMRDDASLDTRRRARIAELRPTGAAEAKIFDELLDRLVSARLLVRGEDGKMSTVEVAHEALIRRWGTLRAWVHEDRAKLIEIADLRVWVEQAKQFPAFLLRDDQLGYARQVLKKYPDDIDSASKALIARSEAEAERQAREAEEQRRRAHDFSLIAGARELLLRGRPAWASKLLLESIEPANTRGWIEVALDVLRARPPRVRLRGHHAAVLSAAFSPDGQRVVTTSRDKTALVWSADGVGMPVVLAGHEDMVRSGAFSPDGQRVLTMSYDRTARVWNADGSGAAVVLKGHQQRLLSATFSPDGQRVVTSSSDGTARIWSALGAAPPVVLRGHEGAVRTAVWSADGQRILTASDDKTARIWRADGTGTAVVLRGHRGPVALAAFDREERSVITTSLDWEAWVWNVESASGAPESPHSRGRVTRAISSALCPNPGRGQAIVFCWEKTAEVWSSTGAREPFLALHGHEADVGRAVFSPDGRRIVTTSRDGTARIWSADGRGGPPIVLPHEAEVFAAAWSADGQRVVTACADKTARIWDVGDGGEPLVFRREAEENPPPVVRADGRQIIAVRDRKTLEVWNPDDLRAPVTTMGDGQEILSVTQSLDGQRLVTTGSSGPAKVWSVDGSKPPVVLRHEIPGFCAVMSPDGSRVVAAYWDKAARVWSADGAGAPVVLPGTVDSPLGLAVSPDGQRVVTVYWNRTAQVWSVDGAGSPAFIHCQEGPEGSLSSGSREISAGESSTLRLKPESTTAWAAVFHPDGQRIVFTFNDKTAWIWRVDGGGLLGALTGHEDRITSVAVSPDGSRIVTGSADKTARVWNADGSGDPVVLSGHEDRIMSVAVSPDGKRIVTASWDKTARVWNADGSGDPIVLRGHEDRLTSAAFTADGERVITEIHSELIHAVRIWTLSIPVLQRRLREANVDCLPPNLRRTYLDETDAEAKERYEACMRAFGRVPG